VNNENQVIDDNDQIDDGNRDVIMLAWMMYNHSKRDTKAWESSLCELPIDAFVISFSCFYPYYSRNSDSQPLKWKLTLIISSFVALYQSMAAQNSNESSNSLSKYYKAFMRKLAITFNRLGGK
jgi:hypothetical protein